MSKSKIAWPLPNVWLGTSISTQVDADANIPPLLKTPAAVRFVSAEPLLEEIDLRETWNDERMHCQRCGHVAALGDPYGSEDATPDEPDEEWAICPECGESNIAGNPSYAAMGVIPISDRPYPPLDWAIVGAESGPNARPCDLKWVRSFRDQCQDAGVPLFVKQIHIDGRLVKDIEQFPPDLQIRQWPENSGLA